MPFCELSDGARIWYEEAGNRSAPPLVFSNSLGTNLAMWDAQVDEAETSFRVIRYDQRGHGRSPVPADAFSMERLGQDVVELLDFLKIDKTDFCGLSMGGMTGIVLARDHPARFGKLALCNTSAHMPPADLWNARIKAVTDNGMEALVDGITERWFTAAFRRDRPDEVERIAEQIRATEPAGYAGCCAAIRDMDLRPTLSAIEADVLILIGDSDPSTPPQDGELIADNIAGARKEIVHAAHLSAVEAPAEFNRAVFSYLRGN
ncbi:3-oxoadipate enol-lactonase [Afifella sp. YEN Y35]|uniref:3-oxoadipate enol-lactonase n=1 Tax=Afifella sp. YEN Y35 TaxID=3388337 RepID=UPI0039E1BEBB